MHDLVGICCLVAINSTAALPPDENPSQEELDQLQYEAKQEQTVALQEKTLSIVEFGLQFPVFTTSSLLIMNDQLAALTEDASNVNLNATVSYENSCSCVGVIIEGLTTKFQVFTVWYGIE